MELLDEKAVSREYGIPLATLRGWRFRGLPPKFLRLGRSVRYRVKDLEAWLASCERRSTSDPGREVGHNGT